MKKLLTLLAGYAAGLAVAMKYRKDAGTSKLQTADGTKAKLDSFIDEVVDIHKSAFEDLKGVVTSGFEEIQDFEGLKTKVTALIDTYAVEAGEKLESLKSLGEEKKSEALTLLNSLYKEKESLIARAKEKALTLTDVTNDVLEKFLSDAEERLQKAHTEIKSKIEKQ